MEDEGSKVGDQTIPRVGVGLQSNDDDEPIGAMMFKKKIKRKSKKVKAGQGIEDKEIGLGEGVLDLGGMGDTLATYKSKLKRPRKTSVSSRSGPRDFDIFGDEVCVRESSSEKLKDEGLVVEESKTDVVQGGSNQFLHKNVEDSLSAFFLKAQSVSLRKSRSSMRSKQLGKILSQNEGLSPGSDRVLEDHLPETSVSQSPLELMTEAGGFDSSLNIVSGSSMDLELECDTNKIKKAQDIAGTYSQESNLELSSSSLIADSVLRSTDDRHSGTQVKMEDSVTISFSQQSDPYLRSCPNTSALQDGEVVGQICDIQEGAKIETLGLDQVIAQDAKGSLCPEVKENLCLFSQEPTFTDRILEDDVRSSSVKKEYDMGNVVAETSMSVSAPERVHTINLSAVEMSTGGFTHTLGQEGFKAVVKSEAYSSDRDVLPKLKHDPKGSYLGSASLSKSFEDTFNETTKLISREHLESSVFPSDNTLTFHEKNFVISKHDEPNFAPVSSQKEEASASLLLSPVSPGVQKQESNFQENQSLDYKQNGDKPDSLNEDALTDKHDTSVPRRTSSFHRTQSSDAVVKGLSVLSCEFSGDEVADGSSSPSTAPDCRRNHTDDMGLVPSPKDKYSKLSAQRAMRNTRKRRQWDMAYEGDADWNFLVHDDNFIAHNQHEDDGMVRRREKLKPSTMFLEAENGRNAAVSYGLKAGAVSPLEKIRFKEVLKRKGGSHMYLECRNHILGLWNKDVTCILPLSGCGVSATPVVDEPPEASLIREIYAFLDHFAYINVGIASEKRVSESPSVYNLQVSVEKNLEGKSGATFADSDDGDSFIFGKSRNPDASLKEKTVALHDSENVVAMDEQDMPLFDLQALKSSTPTDSEKIDDNQGRQLIDGVGSLRIGSLDNLNSASPCNVADGGTAPVIPTEPTKKTNSTLYDTVDDGVNPCVKNNSEVGKEIIIIGAGPSGLAAARHLQRQNFHVTVLEARGRIGGRVFTDRTSLSVPVDLGASIITGVEADVTAERRPDPSTLVCSQMGLELTILNSDCPLYDTVTGHKVPADLDGDLESEFNNLIDDMELLVAQKGEHAMKMSLEDGLEFALQRRRLTQYERNGGTSNLHKLADVIDEEVLGDGNSKGEILSPLERRVMDWHFAHLEYGCAASLKDVSLPCWNQDDIYGGFGGAHCMIKGGYSTVVEALGKGLCIHLNHVVTSVTYSKEDLLIDDDQHHKVKVSTSNGRVFFGDAVLITVPLGCLKKESIKFAPPLPHWKHSSIQRLGFGVLNKVVLEFPKVFWDDSVDYFGATAEETDKRGHCFMFWNVRKTVGAPVLIALVVGRAALDGQHRSSSEHVNHALVVLRKLFGVAMVPDPVASVVTDWGRDPYSYGAYSYVAIGASGEDYDILGSPVENCLFFAGEATCKEHPDTVGGAMMSGIREAVRIMNILTTGIDYTAEVNAMEAAQRCMDSEQGEVRDIIKRLEAFQMSNTLYEKSLDGSHVITRKDLLQDMFSKAKTISGRLHLIKELLNFPVRVLKSFAGTKDGLSILNAWILDSLGKDGTQLLRHCVRLLTLVSTDLLAVRVSGIGKTVKEKVCLHTSRDIRAVASQLVNVWIEVFRKQKASNGGLKLLRQSSAVESSKSKYNLSSGKPPAPHGVPPSHYKKGINPAKMENRTETISNIKVLNSQGSAGGYDSKMDEEKQYVPSEEEKAILAAEEAARAAAIAAAKAYALSGTRCDTSVQLPKIPSFNKYARREHYPQLEEPDICTLEIDSRNCKVRDWSADFSSSHVKLGSSKRSVENLSQHSYSNEVAFQVNFREQSADSAAVDSRIFTKAWVDSAGSEGIKDGSAIERWQSQAAAADSEFYSRTMWMMDEEETNVNLRPSIKKHEGYTSESSTFQVTTGKELVENQPRGPEKIKNSVVDYVASLLMPLYKAKKFDKDGYKSMMKKTVTKVMEQATDAEKSMAVLSFLDSKRKNKIRAFVDILIERHMASKRDVAEMDEVGFCMKLSKGRITK
ncbi:Lysine-specific histone demethylase [Heracleum sosnowskyi]|uniref:Lysine-specific histone demethylase n=1 Tax=Heracleum sosnowskyi TaxID=360622 RepID=A0AAD8H3W7_9APIA|nr:Lysine-specific histone demethylase [Heracleum sosnowskyi]